MRRNLLFHARFKCKHISTNLQTVAVVKRLPSLFLFYFFDGFKWPIKSDVASSWQLGLYNFLHKIG